jgi:hypothetical protein
MTLTKMILAANARILWGGEDSVQSHFTKDCTVVARPDGSALEKRAFFS